MAARGDGDASGSCRKCPPSEVTADNLHGQAPAGTPGRPSCGPSLLRNQGRASAWLPLPTDPARRPRAGRRTVMPGTVMAARMPEAVRRSHVARSRPVTADTFVAFGSLGAAFQLSAIVPAGAAAAPGMAARCTRAKPDILREASTQASDRVPSKEKPRFSKKQILDKRSHRPNPNSEVRTGQPASLKNETCRIGHNVTAIAEVKDRRPI